MILNGKKFEYGLCPSCGKRRPVSEQDGLCWGCGGHWIIKAGEQKFFIDDMPVMSPEAMDLIIKNIAKKAAKSMPDGIKLILLKP